MNQNNSREEIINKRVERYGMAYEGILPKESIDRSKEHWRNELLDFADEITQTFHQELQKARHDWLREEIVKLNKEKFIWLTSEEMKEHDGCRYKRNGMFVGQVAGDNFNGAIQIIQHRYQSELDQPIS